MNNRRAFTTFGTIIVFTVFISILLSLLSMSVNIHKTSINKIDYESRKYKLKSSLIYPELILQDYYHSAFVKASKTIQSEYNEVDIEFIATNYDAINTNFITIIKSEILFVNKMNISLKINQSKLDECFFKINNFNMSNSNQLNIRVTSHYDNKDYVNAYIGDYVINFTSLSNEDIILILTDEEEVLWEKYKNNFIKEKKNVSY